jgi:invasion protein IalB
MRLWTRVGASSLAGAFACLCAFGGGLLAQTAQPKGATGESEAPQEAPAAPPTWKVSCSNSQSGFDCRALQTLFVKRTGQPVLTVAVRIPADTKKPVMLFSLPLGSYLPAGAALQFGQEVAKAMPIQNCDRSGCFAQYAVSNAEIAAMLKGADLTITMQDMQRKPLTFVVPVTGFSEAYAKIK